MIWRNKKGKTKYRKERKKERGKKKVETEKKEVHQTYSSHFWKTNPLIVSVMSAGVAPSSKRSQDKGTFSG